jgi:hypothetical protein
MSRRLLSLATVGLLTAATGAATALGDGGPDPGVMQGWDGITANSAVRYVAVPAGNRTVVEAISRLNGRVLRFRTVRGSLGIPMVAFDGTAGGLSRDGKTLVLGNSYVGGGLRTTSSFAVLKLPKFGIRRMITLQGSFAFDALSPNGRMLYLTEHVSAQDLSRYRVRAYDVGAGRLLKRMVTDRTRWQSVMQGMPISRASSVDGRWAYTLYNGNRHPFIHALDTVRANAVCIDLPKSWRGLDLFGLRLRVEAEGALVVRHRTGRRALAVIDTQKLRILRVVRL